MASAFIIFDNSKRRLTLPGLLTLLDGLGFRCQMSEWRFGATTVPQLQIGTVPPFALQLDEHPDIVPIEIQELLDSRGAKLGEIALAEARHCSSRVEVVSCEPTETRQLSEGGILSYTPDVDVESPDVQLALRRVAAILHGWTFDNINGRWI